MNMKHTPGPWIFGVGKVKQLNGQYLGVGIQAPDPEGDWTPVALLSRADQMTEEDEANGILIAHAPDMLAALLLITQADPFIAKTTDDELMAAMEDEGEEQEVRDQARAFLAARGAIAKATGGQA